MAFPQTAPIVGTETTPGTFPTQAVESIARSLWDFNHTLGEGPLHVQPADVRRRYLQIAYDAFLKAGGA